VAHFFRDLESLGRGIARTQRHIRSLHARIARHPRDSAEARYAGTVLHVVKRSLKMMLAERIGLERKLHEQVQLERHAAQDVAPRELRRRCQTTLKATEPHLFGEMARSVS
jgi:hypothetical protein